MPTSWCLSTHGVEVITTQCKLNQPGNWVGISPPSFTGIVGQYPVANAHMNLTFNTLVVQAPDGQCLSASPTPGGPVLLRTCNAGDPSQRWLPQVTSGYTGTRFQSLSSVLAGGSTLCMNNWVNPGVTPIPNVLGVNMEVCSTSEYEQWF